MNHRFSVVVAAACCLLSLSFVVSVAQSPTGCDKIDPGSWTEDNDDDHLERDAVNIARSFINKTSVGIKWSIKTDNLSDLCFFSLHWHGDNGRTQGDVTLEPSVTEYLVVGLNPGTKYHFHVVTHYATEHKPRSWLLVTTTNGCGPDNNVCNARGSTGCDHGTGLCTCKTSEISGDRCDTCRPGFYLHEHGCVSCDSCVNDGIKSDGNCTAATNPEDSMTCNCIRPYTGRHCLSCEKGFFWKDQECAPCLCYHDKKDGEKSSSTCDPLTGKCDCGAGREGDQCEQCARGYAGDPLAEGCYRISHAGLTALIIVVVIVVVLVAFVAFYLFCHQRGRNSLSKGFWKVHLREEYDKVNFTTLEEEPEVEGDKTRA